MFNEFPGVVRHVSVCLLAGILGVLCLSAGAAESIEAARVGEIASWLPAEAKGFGEPITHRAAWEGLLGRHPELKEVITKAAKLSAQALPEQPDSLFLEYSQNGNRTRWQKVASSRRDRVEAFTLAECLENKGRFIASLEKTIAALCAEKTWVLSAHDPKLRNFRGETIEIDLGSSLLAAELATADYLLAERLPPATRSLLRENLEKRIFAPYRAAANGERAKFWWMRGENNWNAVCLNGVTGAALAVIGPSSERAWYIAVAEKSIWPYLHGGFTPDGYCVEGLSYWNYGFGNFAVLSENIRQATGGKVDLLSQKPAAQPALFGLRSEIVDGIWITIADCHPGEKPSGILMNYLCRRMGLNLAPWKNAALTDGLYEKMAFGFPSPEPVGLPASHNLDEFPWRTWFSDSGVLICRPGGEANIPFATAIKGGNNGVSHGHHDAGSFSVVLGTNMVICDPGGEVYTSRTFSSHRYDSQVLNSFGHAVPVVAGHLQKSGSTARAVVMETNFSAATDVIRLDLRSAYAMADLQKLERTFTYRRGASPSLAVSDEVRFSAPEPFETALITWGEPKVTGPYTLKITDGGSALQVTLDTQGIPVEWSQETIEEDVSSKRKPIRIGMKLKGKISGGIVTMRISPIRNY